MLLTGEAERRRVVGSRRLQKPRTDSDGRRRSLGHWWTKILRRNLHSETENDGSGEWWKYAHQS